MVRAPLGDVQGLVANLKCWVNVFDDPAFSEDTVELMTLENGECPSVDIQKAASTIERMAARIARLEEALTEIVGLEPASFTYPPDWQQQIDNCEECKRYKSHPIQQGICDTHRQPMWEAERHRSFEEKAIGYRAKSVARAALASPETKIIAVKASPPTDTPPG